MSGQLVTPRLIGKGASTIYSTEETLFIGDLQPTLDKYVIILVNMSKSLMKT